MKSDLFNYGIYQPFKVVLMEEKSKLKLFIENFLIYGVGGVISKIIPFVMLPIIIYLLPDSRIVGISDLSNTLVSLMSAFAVMGMYDALYRMFFEREYDTDYKKKLCSTTLIYTIFCSIIVFLIMMVGRTFFSKAFLKDSSYEMIVVISAFTVLVGATNTIVSAPTRMQNKRGIFLITNTLGPIISYSIAIIMIINGYYYIALPLAGLISALIIEVVFYFLNKEWFSLELFDKKIIRDLLQIAIPLLPNFLVYWVFNSFDKVMIAELLTVSEEGIYSVAAKIGQISQLIYVAFAGGWQYFSFVTMREKKQVEMNSKIFEYLGIISFVATMGLCSVSYLLFQLFFPKEYLKGYVVAPYLFLAPLLQMMFQVIANQFLVIKKTWPNLFILSGGALINVVLNYMLIPRIGIEGASIATLIGYIVSVTVCCFILNKMKLFVVSKKFLMCAIGIVIYWIIWRFYLSKYFVFGIVLWAIIVVIYIVIYRKELMKLKRLIKKQNVD